MVRYKLDTRVRTCWGFCLAKQGNQSIQKYCCVIIGFGIYAEILKHRIPDRRKIHEKTIFWNPNHAGIIGFGIYAEILKHRIPDERNKS